METIIKINYLKLVIHIYNSDRRVKKNFKKISSTKPKIKYFKKYNDL